MRDSMPRYVDICMILAIQGIKKNTQNHGLLQKNTAKKKQFNVQTKNATFC